MTLLATADSFNRADSASALGNTDGAGFYDPQPWVMADGFSPFSGTAVWGISTNQAYTPGTGSSRAPIAVVDAHTGDQDVRVTVNHSGASPFNQAALIFRYSDPSNYWRVFLWTTSPLFALEKFVGGVFTNVGQLSTSTTHPRVLALGSSIQVFDHQSSALLFSTTDTDLMLNTKCGILTQNEFTPPPFGDTVARFDDFSATAPNLNYPLGGQYIGGPLQLSMQGWVS